LYNSLRAFRNWALLPAAHVVTPAYCYMQCHADRVRAHLHYIEQVNSTY